MNNNITNIPNVSNNNLNENPNTNILKSSLSNLTSSIKDKPKMYDSNEAIEESFKKPTMVKTTKVLKDKPNILNSPSATSNILGNFL